MTGEPNKLGRNPFAAKRNPPPSFPITVPAAEPSRSLGVRPRLEFLLVEAPAQAVVLGVRLWGLVQTLRTKKKDINASS